MFVYYLATPADRLPARDHADRRGPGMFAQGQHPRLRLRRLRKGRSGPAERRLGGRASTDSVSCAPLQRGSQGSSAIRPLHGTGDGPPGTSSSCASRNGHLRAPSWEPQLIDPTSARDHGFFFRSRWGAVEGRGPPRPLLTRRPAGRWARHSCTNQPDTGVSFVAMGAARFVRRGEFRSATIGAAKVSPKLRKLRRPICRVPPASYEQAQAGGHRPGPGLPATEEPGVRNPNLALGTEGTYVAAAAGRGTKTGAGPRWPFTCDGASGQGGQRKRLFSEGSAIQFPSAVPPTWRSSYASAEHSSPTSWCCRIQPERGPSRCRFGAKVAEGHRAPDPHRTWDFD